MTRKVNHPELIFNQSLKYDNTKYRFFKKDASQQWKLSRNNECYVCNKYTYTIIFYEKSILYPNKGLTEIKDSETLNIIKKDFDRNYKHFGSMTPIICGTVVNNGMLKPFQRKLKMIRTSLFALLQIC